MELVSINGKTRSDLEKFEAELNKWAAKTLSSCQGLFRSSCQDRKSGFSAGMAGASQYFVAVLTKEAG